MNAMEGDYQEADEFPEECEDQEDDMDEEMYEEEEMELDQQDEEGDEEGAPDKSENPSTYESISDIKMDQTSLKISQTAATAPNVEPKQTSPKLNSEANECTSADISSMSYNTVPEQLYIPSQGVYEADSMRIDMECAAGDERRSESDTDDDEDSDIVDDGETRETREKQGSRRGGRQCYRKRKTKSSKSPGSIKKTKSSSNKRDKSKQKSFTKTGSKTSGTKLAAQRNLIKPETQTMLDSNAPKRPLTAFKLFMNEFRSKYSTKYPNISFAEMTDIGAEVWRDMPTLKKTEFQDEANRQQDEYLNQMKEYQSKKQHERFAKPKTAYQIFMSDYLNKEYEKRKNLKTQSRLTKQDLFMRAVRKWNRLTKNQKRPYEEQSRIRKSTQSLCL